MAPPEAKIVLAVFPDTTVSRPMVEALGFSGGTRVVSLGEYADLKLVYEAGTPEATADQLLFELANPDVVLVIGHESSTTVLHLLETVYATKSNRPIPLVLPAVTNPAVLRRQSPGKGHILRIPAADNEQVETIAEFVKSISAAKKKENAKATVTLLVDESNPAYSNYITKELVPQLGPVEVVDSLGVGLMAEGFDPARLLSAKPGIVVFIGMEVQADIFLRRVKASGIRLWHDDGDDDGDSEGLVLIFTDGTAGDVFDAVRQQILGEGESIFLTGPFSVPSDCGKGDLVSSFPDYAGLSRTALDVAEELISEAKNSGDVSRKSVLQALRNKLGASVEVAGARFNKDGENIRGTEHVFQLTRSQIFHAQFCPCDR